MKQEITELVNNTMLSRKRKDELIESLLDVSGSLVSPNAIQKEAEKYQQATANKMSIERTAFAQGALWVRSLLIPNER